MPKHEVRVQRVRALVLEVIGLDFGVQPNAASFLPQVEHATPATVSHRGQGRVQLWTAITPKRAKGITGQALRVDADQHGIWTAKITHGQGNVFKTTIVGDHFDAEGAVGRWQGGHAGHVVHAHAITSMHMRQSPATSSIERTLCP